MYFGEAILNEGFFDRFKKKKEEPKKDETHRAPTAEEIKNIKTLVKGYVTYFNSSKAKSDPVVVKATNKFYEVYNDMKSSSIYDGGGKENADEEMNNGKIPKLSFEIFEENDDQLYIEICNNSQYCNDYYSKYIINEMINKLKKDISNYSEFIRKMSSGDGDEGILYIDFYK